MNTIEAKRIRIVDYLRLLGHEPVKVRGGQYWYLSPLRKEDTPSFKVNDRLNEWYDFGLSEGGSIIERERGPSAHRGANGRGSPAPHPSPQRHARRDRGDDERRRGGAAEPPCAPVVYPFEGYRYADRPAVLSGDTLRTAQAALLRHRLRERIGRLRDAQSLL